MKNPPAPIDAVQIAALRQCDDVCFVHNDGQSYIRAIKRAKPTAADPFAAERECRVDCGTRWADYTRDSGMSWPVPEFHGFEMTGNYRDGLWETIAALLRKGDELTLHWQRGAGNHEAMRGVNFACDLLDLVVTRGARQLRFRVDHSVVPEHSTARMIRDVRPREVSLV